MQFLLLSLLALAPTAVLGDGLKITSPIGGASIAAGATFTVSWDDGGGSPDLSQLSSISAITYYFGGNQIGTDALSVGACSVASVEAADKKVSCIAPGGAVAKSITNGFYLAIASNVAEGGTVINYSERFSVTGLIGGDTSPSTAAIQAAGAIAGVDDVPKDVLPDTQNAADPAASTGAAVGPATVSYNLQTGLTKYAPMQPVPPTKITAKGYSRLFPTSSFSIASNWMPPPTILTTITASQTFSVKSIENTVAPVAGPSASRAEDMAKYLARWKD